MTRDADTNHNLMTKAKNSKDLLLRCEAREGDGRRIEEA
jgi:hypothetical protein